LKRRAPMYAPVPNSDCQLAIDEADRWTSEAQWGLSHYDDGILYLACHILDEAQALASASVGQSGGALQPGPVSSEKILTWSVTYAVSEGGTWDDALATTAWGRKYLALRGRVFTSRIL